MPETNTAAHPPEAGSPDADPFEVVSVGAGLMAGAANVIMQLGRPGVGYGVLESKVDSGNLFHHPWKRARTTFTYLAVAALGTDDDKRAFRKAVNRQHAQVRSGPDSPVEYNAFDPELQLWVAACLFKGYVDGYEALLGGPMPEPLRERLFEASPRLGTTLQVRAEMWPATPAEFDDYWKRGLEEVSIDPPVAKLLLAVADLEFLPAVLRIPLGPANRWLTTGFLPPVFREQLGLQWTERDQRRFERVTRGIGSVVLRMPRAVQQVPYNLFLRDLRRRIRAGKPLV